MSVLKSLQKMTPEKEFAATKAEYLEETRLLREATHALNESLAKEARRIMEEAGISQNELQRRLKISSRTMDGIMKGKANPTLSTMVKLAALSGRMPDLIWK